MVVMVVVVLVVVVVVGEERCPDSGLECSWWRP